MAAKDAIVEEKQNKTKTHKMLLICVSFLLLKKKINWCLSMEVVQGQWMEGALFSEQLGLSLKQHSWMFNFPFFS